MLVDYLVLEEDGKKIFITTPDAPDDRGGPVGGNVNAVTESIRRADFQEMIKAIGDLMKGALDRLEHVSKATVEVGLDIGFKDGQLMALILRGNVNATFKLTMEWSKDV
jgi:hypothetical protein